MSSKLYFYYGTMSSAKTLNLLATAFNADKNGTEVLCLKPSTDTREGTAAIIKSRAGLQRECILIYREDNIYEPIQEYADALEREGTRLQWVYVDECQFLTPKQVEQLSDVVDYLDVNVACYGLRTDFQTKLFPGAQRLFELADTVQEIKLSCKCGGKAIVNARVRPDGSVICSGEQVMIGGDESYVPMCRHCWKEHLKCDE